MYSPGDGYHRNNFEAFFSRYEKKSPDDNAYPNIQCNYYG